MSGIVGSKQKKREKVKNECSNDDRNNNGKKNESFNRVLDQKRVVGWVEACLQKRQKSK